MLCTLFSKEVMQKSISAMKLSQLRLHLSVCFGFRFRCTHWIPISASKNPKFSFSAMQNFAISTFHHWEPPHQKNTRASFNFWRTIFLLFCFFVSKYDQKTVQRTSDENFSQWRKYLTTGRRITKPGWGLVTLNRLAKLKIYSMQREFGFRWILKYHTCIRSHLRSVWCSVSAVLDGFVTLKMAYVLSFN